jgi:hypothetical protein
LAVEKCKTGDETGKAARKTASQQEKFWEGCEMKTTIVKKWMLLVFALVLAFTLLAQVEPALAGISTTPSDKICRSCTSMEPAAINQGLFEPVTFTFAGLKMPLIQWSLWH